MTRRKCFSVDFQSDFSGFRALRGTWESNLFVKCSGNLLGYSGSGLEVIRAEYKAIYRLKPAGAEFHLYTDL